MKGENSITSFCVDVQICKNTMARQGNSFLKHWISDLMDDDSEHKVDELIKLILNKLGRRGVVCQRVVATL